MISKQCGNYKHKGGNFVCSALLKSTILYHIFRQFSGPAFSGTRGICVIKMISHKIYMHYMLKRAIIREEILNFYIKKGLLTALISFYSHILNL